MHGKVASRPPRKKSTEGGLQHSRSLKAVAEVDSAESATGLAAGIEALKAEI